MEYIDLTNIQLSDASPYHIITELSLNIIIEYIYNSIILRNDIRSFQFIKNQFRFLLIEKKTKNIIYIQIFSYETNNYLIECFANIESYILKNIFDNIKEEFTYIETIELDIPSNIYNNIYYKYCYKLKNK